MAITTTGYSLKRFEDILSEVRSEMIAASGNPNLNLSDDSLLGQLNTIWCSKLSELHELAQALWSAGDVDTATGTALDRLVRRARISRLQPVKAIGELHFTGNLGAVVNTGTQVKDLAGNVVQTLTQLVINTDDINGVVFNIVVRNNETYTIILDTVQYIFVSDSTATATEIVNGIINALSNNTSIVATNVSGQLSLQSLTKFSFSTSNNLTVVNVTKAIQSEAVLASAEEFEAGTLTYPVSSIGSASVTNRQKWQTGRLLETDNELRSRFYLSRGGAGNATLEAIYAKVSSLSSVQSAYVEENYTEVTNIDGIPAKSFEVTVKGGSDVEVANAVWQSKPAGIRTHGNTSYIIKDSQNVNQTIFFSRPIDAYIHVRVQYQVYSEELFPSNGEEMIVRAVKSYGDSLGLNNDVNPQRIMSAIYQSVSGINNLIVQVGKTANPLDTPIYSTSNISIERKEEAIFDVSRINVSIL